MSNQDTLANALRRIVDEAFKAGRLPILLSSLPPMLEKEVSGTSYRDLLEGKSIKKFITETGENSGYKLVEHPTQKAKIGLIPADANFEFPSNQDETKKERPAERKIENAAITFFRALADLPDEDLEKISIPVSVIVKLLK